MKKTSLTLASVALMLTLTACAPNGSTAPTEVVPETAPTQTAETPTPTPTQREPERVEFSDSIIAWSDIDAVLEADNVPVLLLPVALDASITIIGAPPGSKWHVENPTGAQVLEQADGTVKVTPFPGYDAFKDPQDFARDPEQSVHIGDLFAFRVEGVTP